MKKFLPIILWLGLACQSAIAAQNEPATQNSTDPQMQQAEQKVETLKEPLYTPFIERYVLDEIKSLRQEQLLMRSEMIDKIANSKLESSDRALRYTSDTVNNVFFIITAAASVLVLMGWRSLRDIQTQIEEHVSQKVSKVSQEYEHRLKDVEEKLKRRSEQILLAQEEISLSNQLHALWMRAGLETNPQQRVKIYDEILALNKDDVEAITYKADAVIELGECEWALSLSTKAIELDINYALAYWQRACAEAALGQTEAALADINIALEKSPALMTELSNETMFESLYEIEAFQALLNKVAVS
ncbi:tetratricopeptide repeat protein [Catenovulum sp. 2E275]|uniref:TPR end-of-group domain-containing protein n=1 Tax=Catenovulum sp. 2E275 TaxID=2980497 RepID=UPI0021D2C235|nr:tetratricopeptide repeat protein [Catenovulum sp. 2E275]MCU4674401.1 tetratricopeptide repeat protein [Catenovulum sp. 2E275]